MSLKTVQQRNKCYCNSVASSCCNSHVNCFKRKITGGRSVFSATTKSKKDKQNFNKTAAEVSKPTTDFVKIRCKAGSTEANKNRRGLGHSHSRAVAATNFSRRNSAATTVTFSTPCATPARTHSSNATTPTPITLSTSTSPPSSVPASPTTILKATPVTMAALGDSFRALRVATKSESCGILGSALQHEYTERRRYYESAKQLMGMISAQSDNYSTIAAANNGSASGCNGNCAAADAAFDVERLRALQQFRLKNADECFSVHRQLELQLPTQRKELAREADERHTRDLWRALLERENVALSEDGSLKSVTSKAVPKTVARESVSAHAQERMQKLQRTSLTPYAVRQKLLQLRLEAEEVGRLKPGRKLYGAQEESCSLRHQATF